MHYFSLKISTERLESIATTAEKSLSTKGARLRPSIQLPPKRMCLDFHQLGVYFRFYPVMLVLGLGLGTVAMALEVWPWQKIQGQNLGTQKIHH